MRTLEGSSALLMRRERGHKKALLVSTGGMFCEVLKSARMLLKRGVETDIFSLRFIKPFDFDSFAAISSKYDAVVFVEDGVRSGGVGEMLENALFERGIAVKMRIVACPDRFLAQGTREQILEDCGMSPKDIAAAALDALGADSF